MPVKTLPSGYQLFDRGSLLRAKHIQSLKRERYTLSEIGDILSKSAYPDT